MDNNESNLTPEENIKNISSNEPPRSESTNKKLLPIAAIVGLILVIVLIIALTSTKSTKDQSTNIEPSTAPAQNAEEKIENPPSDVQTEADSIQVDDVDSNFSVIDKDLKELN